MPNLMSQIVALASNTLRHAVRQKLLYALLIFAVLGLGGTGVFGALSLHQQQRVFFDSLLLGTTIFTCCLAIYLAVSSIHREIETGTVFTVISKPVSRQTFTLGKYVGVSLTTLLGLATLVTIQVLAALLLEYELRTSFFVAYLGVSLQALVVAAIAILFSNFAAESLTAAMLSLGVFIAGSLTPQLSDAAAHFRNTGNPVGSLLEVVVFVLPDLYSLNFSFELTHSIEVPSTYLLSVILYAAVYVALTLVLASLQLLFRELA